MKKLALSKLIELNLCDMWQIRNHKSKTFTFWQHHLSRILQRRMEYLFISNNTEESTKNVEMLNAISTGLFTIILFFPKLISRHRGLWKFINSLISNSNFVNEMKTIIQKVIFGVENGT